MAAITNQQLNNAAADAQSLEDLVNGDPNRVNSGQPNGTITTRLGRVIKVCARAVLDIFNWQGTWSSGTTYAVGQVITRLGSSYISLQASNLNHAPEGSPTWWGLLASKGTDGINGTNGVNGAQGPQGPQGPQGAQGPTGTVAGGTVIKAYAMLTTGAGGAVARDFGLNIGSASYNGPTLTVNLNPSAPNAAYIVLALPRTVLPAGAAYIETSLVGLNQFELTLYSSAPAAINWDAGREIAVAAIW